MRTQTLPLLNRLVAFKYVGVGWGGGLFKAGESQLHSQGKLGKRMKRKGILVIIKGIPPLVLDKSQTGLLQCSSNCRVIH